jgi:hypothetical protein
MSSTQQRIEDYFADTLAECQADQIGAAEVAEAFVAALDGWIGYHKQELDQYTAVLDELRKRICQA